MNHARVNSKSEAVARWLRESFSWKSIRSGLVTLCWLVPVTVVIWVYADRAQVVPVDNVSIPIGVQSSDPNRFVMLDMEDEATTITAQLSGPLSRIDDIRKDINPTDGKPTVIIPIESSLPRGTHDLDTATQLAQSQIFRYSGISIKDCKPARIRVIVDEYEERELDVHLPTTIANLVGTQSFTPAKVRVRAPRGYFPASSEPLAVVADIPRASVVDKPTGQSKFSTASVSLPQLSSQAGVTYTPATVEAVLDVRPRDVPGKIGPAAVYLEISKENSDKYIIHYDTSIPSIRVFGSPEKIEEMTNSTVRPYLVLKIQPEDRITAGQRRTKALEFRQLPDQIRIDPEDAAKINNFEYRLEERPAQQ